MGIVEIFKNCKNVKIKFEYEKIKCVYITLEFNSLNPNFFMASLVICLSKCIEDKLFYPYTEELYFQRLRRKQKKQN